MKARNRLQYDLSLSVGMACFEPQEMFSIEDLMVKADEELYEQKRLRQNLTPPPVGRVLQGSCNGATFRHWRLFGDRQHRG